MKKITRETIEKLEKELREETTNAKRKTFLKATINIYCKRLGMKERYSFN